MLWAVGRLISKLTSKSWEKDMEKNKNFAGKSELFFWGRESQEACFTVDEYVLEELEGSPAPAELGNDRNLLTFQRVLVRELIMLGFMKLEVKATGPQNFSYKATFHDQCVIQNEAPSDFGPIWTWWPEYISSIKDPNDIGQITVIPSIPGVREWNEHMFYANMSDERKSELVTFLIGILSENEMLPMEFLLACLIFHPATPGTETLLLKSLIAQKTVELSEFLSESADIRLKMNSEKYKPLMQG